MIFSNADLSDELDFDRCLKADPVWLRSISNFTLPLQFLEEKKIPNKDQIAFALRCCEKLDGAKALEVLTHNLLPIEQDYGLSYAIRAAIHFSHDELAEAMALAEQCVAAFPAFAGYHATLGVIYVRAQLLNKAVYHFIQAVQLEANPTFYAYLSLIYTLGTYWPEAEYCARNALRHDESNTQRSPNLCLFAALYAQGKSTAESMFDTSYDEKIVSDEMLFAALPSVSLEQLRHPTLGEAVLFVACDMGYFVEHALALLCSLAERALPITIHIHLFNPVAETPAIIAMALKQFPSLDCHFSLEMMPFDRDHMHQQGVYFSSVRFCRLYQFIQANQFTKPVIMTDVDILVKNNILTAKGLGEKGVDMGLVYGDDEPLWCKISAGFCYFNPTAHAQAFLQRVSQLIITNWQKHNRHWFLDQVAFIAALDYCKQNKQLNMMNLQGASCLTIQFEEEALVWAVVQDQKTGDNVYNQYKKELLKKYAFEIAHA